MALRLGLLSTAQINRDILNGAALTDAVDVIAVASRDPERAQAYAREKNIERAHGSYDDLVADDAVDAIYIGLPNSMHVEWSIRALESGKHVLCEKPFDRRPEAVGRAFDVADERGLVLMEAFMWRHHPQTAALGEVVRSGRIGDLRHIVSSFTYVNDRPNDVRWDPALDGGSLMDIGAYCVSGARFLAGEPLRVIGFEVHAPSGVDIRFTGALEFASEVTAEFHCAFDLPADSFLEAIGSEGRVVVRSPWQAIDPHLEIDGERVETGDDDRYKLQLENFAAAVRGDRPQLLGRDDAVGQARTIDALYRSAATGAAVSL